MNTPETNTEYQVPQISNVNIFLHNIDRSLWVRVLVFNATFNNISAILWQSVLLVGETGVPEENHQPAASH